MSHGVTYTADLLAALAAGADLGPILGQRPLEPALAAHGGDIERVAMGRSSVVAPRLVQGRLGLQSRPRTRTGNDLTDSLLPNKPCNVKDEVNCG